MLNLREPDGSQRIPDEMLNNPTP